MDVTLPCIAYWRQRHFVVVYKVSKKFVWVADPALGKKKYGQKEFEKGWYLKGNTGILLLFEPSPRFYEYEPQHQTKQRNLSYLFKYLIPYKKLFIQLGLGILLGSIFALLLPFLTQAVVDLGIANQDIDFIYLILLGQIVLFVSSTVVETIQSWIFLHVGTRVSISLVHDFLTKLTKLPLGFYDRRTIGDLLQRIEDHELINNFLTGTTFGTIFSLFNSVVFSVILFYYNSVLFVVYWILSFVYLVWIFLFLKKRKEIDYKRFEIAAANQTKLVEIIQGIQEIKLQNSERKRRWQWVDIQAKMFRVSIKALAITQIQGTGASFINQLKNILISFLAAKAVIEGEMTLGMMLAVQYIIGQLNAPLSSFVSLAHSAQDAKIGLERLNEIHDQDEEESHKEHKTNAIPKQGSIVIDGMFFNYQKDADYVLKDIHLTIPRNKVTAIVGSSGSGKTSLVKLLLGFYPPTKGNIKIGGIPIGTFKNSIWRSECGAVMQDGFIFPDTVAHNIGESDDYVDNEKLFKASTTANAHEFIELLHAGYNTVIGEQGVKLSQGQKQRILIARAIYKDPSFMFFDEATNALDTKNERSIMEHLEEVYQGRTVVVVAHRLSTIKNADQIVVLEKGLVVEVGTHAQLLAKEGYYYSLVSSQLEFG